MKVLDDKGIVVAESPSREPEAVAKEALAALARDNVQTDVSNLAPVSLELEAVRRYQLCGSLAQVSREMGIAIYELQKLQKTKWWQEELAALRREETAIKNVTLARLHHMSLVQLEDRLAHGDLIARGSGFVRQKLSGRDLARISESIFKQRQILLGEPTDIVRANNQLATLADKLRALGSRDPLAAARIIESEAVDVKATVVSSTGDATPGDAPAHPGVVEYIAEGDA
jgi:hypothetical protein